MKSYVEIGVTVAAFLVVFFPFLTFMATAYMKAVRKVREARATVRLSQNPPKRKGGWKED